MILVLAAAGLAVGLALDALIVRLGVPPDDDEGEPAIDTAPALDALAVHRAEAGTLAVTFDTSARAWLRRLAVVATTAGLFALAGWRFDDVGQAAIVAAYVSVLIVCAGTDLMAYRVPNVVTYPAILGAAAVAILLPDANVWDALAGGALAGGVLLLPSILTGGRGMGMGDVKLAIFVGLALGFTHVSPALLMMALGGGAVALFLLVTRIRKKGEPIPYAPFISAGSIAALLWQGAVFVDLT